RTQVRCRDRDQPTWRSGGKRDRAKRQELGRAPQESHTTADRRTGDGKTENSGWHLSTGNRESRTDRLNQIVQTPDTKSPAQWLGSGQFLFSIILSARAFALSINRFCLSSWVAPPTT